MLVGLLRQYITAQLEVTMDTPSGQPQVVSRQRLYEEVWQTPLTKLAPKYGLTAQELTKVCDRHGIPRPSSFHWVMVRHGYEVEREPLPAAEGADAETITLPPARPRKSPRLPRDVAASGEQPAPDSPRTVVPDRLESPHRLTLAAREQLRAAKPDDSHLVRTNPETALNIRVASSSVPRALRLFDTLVKAWEGMGGEVGTGGARSTGHHTTALTLGKGTVLLGLSERTEAFGKPIPPKYEWQRPTVQRRGNSELVFAVEVGVGEGLQRTWADGKRQRLEEMVDSILLGLRRLAEADAQWIADRECERRQEERARARRAEMEQQEAKEKKRREELLDYVERWHRAGRIRTFLGEVRAKLSAQQLRPANQESFLSWVDWAAWYADHLDPLVRAPPRAEDVTPPANVPLSQVELTSRTREVVSRLGIVDSHQLARVSEDQVDRNTKYSYVVWREINLVLVGLGYRTALAAGV